MVLGLTVVGLVLLFVLGLNLSIDFDGGGRFTCQLTDAHEVAIGDRVRMTFRRIMTANGVHNYFWKAKPLDG